MWTVARPEFEVEETFMLCVSKIVSDELRERLERVSDAVVDAAMEYSGNATRQDLHLFPQVNNVAGVVTRDEMIAVYDGRMVAKRAPGRSIYDAIKLLPDYGICPYCDHGNVSTIDHVLPKTHYPILAVTPDNLVGCCKDCNKEKGTLAPAIAADAMLHPYFDDVTDELWLTARTIEGSVAAVIFRTARQMAWSDDLNDRVANQFRLLKLDELYSKQAARIISGHRTGLIGYHEHGGAPAVRAELEHHYETWSAYRLNCWQAATFHALSASDWFCDEGHRH
jgi:hypothetical protein